MRYLLTHESRGAAVLNGSYRTLPRISLVDKPMHLLKIHLKTSHDRITVSLEGILVGKNVGTPDQHIET